MINIIAEIWNGNIDPVRSLGENNSELKNLEDITYRKYEKLNKNLNKEQAEMFKIYNDRITEYVCLISKQAFCDGFSLGARITSEALNDADKMVLK